MHLVARSDGSRRAATALVLVLASALLLTSNGCTRLAHLPAVPDDVQPDPSGPEAAAIEQREICVGSKVASAGKLAETLYYQASVLPDGKLAVGYFAFFSEERPWGNNWLTWTLLPALAVDVVYTRGAFFAPGLQRALSGKGDVEGFHVIYAMNEDGTLAVERAVADDGLHRAVHLDAKDVLAMDPERPTFYSDVWSHQLGARGVKSMADLAYVRCFGQGRVLPLPDSVHDEFAVARRAWPAHVGGLGGRRIGAPETRWASGGKVAIKRTAAAERPIANGAPGPEPTPANE